MCIMRRFTKPRLPRLHEPCRVLARRISKMATFAGIMRPVIRGGRSRPACCRRRNAR